MIRASLYLVAYSMRRQLFSRKVIVSAGLLGMAIALVVLSTLWRDEITARWFGRSFVLGPFSMFIFPMILLSFGTGALGDDRDEKTLVYLVTRPMPRWAIYVGKLASVTPIALLLSVGGLWVLCTIAAWKGGEGMERMFSVLLPAFLLSALAYLAVFHFLATIFRHSTIIAIVYVLFVEAFLGTVPGLIKRVSIRFFALSRMFEDGRDLRLTPPEDLVFEPVPGTEATIALAVIAAGFLAIGAFVFQRREYRDTV